MPISVLLTFNTLKKITTDVAMVAKAADGSDVVEVNEKGDAIRRKDAKFPNAVDKTATRIFAAGFPESGTTWMEIRDAFSVAGKVVYVQMRRDRSSKAFVGSAFIDFSTEDGAKKAVEEPPMFNGEKLHTVKRFADWRRKGSKGNKAPRQQPPKEIEIDMSKCILRVKGLKENDDWNAIKADVRTLIEENNVGNKDIRVSFVEILNDGVAFLKLSCTAEEAGDFVKAVSKPDAKITIDGTPVEVDYANEEEIKSYWERTKLKYTKAMNDSRFGRNRKRDRDEGEDKKDASEATSTENDDASTKTEEAPAEKKQKPNPEGEEGN